jgi:hypothetical protein
MTETTGFQKKYSTDKDFVYVELFEDGTNREVPAVYKKLKDWTGSIPAVAGNQYITIDAQGNVTFDAAKQAADQLAAEWDQVRVQRDGLIAAILWRAERYERQIAAKIPTNDTENQYLEVLLYIQTLRDITKQTDPLNITWPVVPA